MLVIVLLGLIANLVLVSGDCDLGNATLHDFDYSRYSGPRPWYILKHFSEETERNFDCARATYGSPEGNTSLLTTNVYDKNAQVHRTLHGYITNWNNTGYFEYYNELQTWNGIGHIIAVDYDRYYIGKYCSEGTHKLYVYVAYRSPHPDQETVNEVNTQLQEKNVDASQLLDWSVDHCPQEESSTAGGSST